jgi:hypothetical protein
LSDFHVIEIGGADWKAELLSHIRAPGLLTLPGSALTAILEMAESGLKTRTVVVEPYVSTDFADEYAAFYSRIFQDVPRVCRRLHFFRGIGENGRPVSKADLLNMPKEVQGAYLGYTVVELNRSALVF